MKLTATVVSSLLGLTFCAAPILARAAAPVHSVILFVPDGLRAAKVTRATAPAMAAIAQQGVSFRASHSLFPTLTTANAAALATGHLLGDTGNFSNTIYVGFPVKAARGSVTPYLESNAVLAELDQHFGGNYLDEQSILAAARASHIQTAAIGKLGPVAIQDLASQVDNATLIVDDSTGRPGGVPLPPGWSEAFARAGIAAMTPKRGENENQGDFKTPGTTVANVDQQNYLVDVLTRVVLPRFKEEGRPFLVVFWSRDPDGTQHNQGDSLGRLEPGINGATSLAAIRNADNNLAAIRDALKAQGLIGSTDIVVAADHGFSTISKESRTSSAARGVYEDVAPGQLPPGFLAIDLWRALSAVDPGVKLFDPADANALIGGSNQHPRLGSALIGRDPAAPELVIAANGGSDLIYLPQANASALAPQVVEALLAQDYVSGMFVDDDLGRIPGTLTLSAIGLKGKAVTPTPAIVVNFRSFATGCKQPVLCTVEVADTILQQGQGMHGSFSRADTWNFMAAMGPDFRSGYIDRLPASNADIGRTIARILKLEVQVDGQLRGRVLEESFPGGRPGHVVTRTITSDAAANGLRTVLSQQKIGGTVYTDAAGFPGRTVGLGK